MTIYELLALGMNPHFVHKKLYIEPQGYDDDTCIIGLDYY